MAKISDLSTLSKTSVTASDYLLASNINRQTNRKFALSDLFPSLTTVGTGGESLYVDVSSKNNLRFKGILNSDGKISVSTVSNNILLALVEAQIDLDNCDNSTAGFLKTVDLTAATGTLPVANGGTNASSFADKAIIASQLTGTDTLRALQMTTNGQLIIGGTSGPQVATLTAGSNITITNADGGITIAATFSSIGADLDMNNFDIDLGTGYLSSTGASNGIRVTGNNAYVGSSANYFDDDTLNLEGGITFLQNLSHTIKVKDGTTPGVLSLLAQSTTATNGNGGNLKVAAGDGNGTGTGGTLGLYGGDTGTGTAGKINFYIANAVAASLESNSDFLLKTGDLVIGTNTKGLKYSSIPTVTQTTDYTTGVTINGTVGIITLENTDTLAAHSSASFTVTNSAATTSSAIFLTGIDNTGTGELDFNVSNRTNGSFDIIVGNHDTGTSTAGDIKVQFLIINS